MFFKKLSLLAVIFSLAMAEVVIAASLFINNPLEDPFLYDDMERELTLRDANAFYQPYRVKWFKAAQAGSFLKKNHYDKTSRAAGFLNLSQSFGVIKNIANSNGLTTEDNRVVNGQLQWQQSDNLSMGFNVVATENRESVPQFVLSVGTDALTVDIGHRVHRVSPFADGALLTSQNAVQSPSITFSNLLGLGDWHWQYQLFIKQLDLTDGVIKDPDLPAQTVRPNVMGTFLSFKPMPWFEMGLNRTFQFASEGKNLTLVDFWNAFIDPVSADNAESEDAQKTEFGNQQASVQFAMNIDTGIPWRAYLEYAGEDTASYSNLRLGNLAVFAGLYFPSLWHATSVRIETGEWQTSWYRHHLFLKGYRNKNRSLGHWFGDERLAVNDQGGENLMLAIRHQIDEQHDVYSRYRKINFHPTSDFMYATGHELLLQYQYKVTHYTVGVQAYLGNTVADKHFRQLGLYWSWQGGL